VDNLSVALVWRAGIHMNGGLFLDKGWNAVDNQHSTTHCSGPRVVPSKRDRHQVQRAVVSRSSRWAPRLLVLVGVAVLLMSTTAVAKLNTGWLLPSGDIPIDLPQLDGQLHKFCALTFDDGPDAKYTGQIMGILDSLSVRATFFLIGDRIEDYPLTTEALVASGHEIGSHSLTHKALNRLGADSQRKELAGVNKQLAQYGVTPQWFRPPYGKYSEATIRLARELGMKTVNWSVDPRDWTKPGVDTITSRVLNNTEPGAVILLHSTNAQTVAALPGIIEELGARGYSFVTMSEWHALVTGETAPRRPKVREYSPGIGGKLAEPLRKLLRPRREIGASNADVPRMIEKLEKASPGRQVWSAQQDTDMDEPSTSANEQIESPETPIPTATDIPASTSTEQLTVYTNFGDCTGLCRVFAEGGNARMQRVSSGIEHKVEVLLQPAEQGKTAPQEPVEIEDVVVEPAASLPVVPEGEVLIIPPDAVPPAALVDGAIEEERPVAEPEPAAGPVKLDPLPFRIVDLADMENAATAWRPPESIAGASLTGWQPPVTEPGPRAEPDYYFLAMVGDIEEYTWVELGTYLRLARLSGMVLPAESYYGLPPADASYPWTYANMAYLDRGAWVDLTVEDIADVMELIKRGKDNVFIIVRPANLHFFIAAHLWAEMNTNMRDFALFRQMTGGMEYSPEPSAGDWELPAGVELARFSDGSRVTLVLYSQSYKEQVVQVPSSASHFSHAFIDAGGYLKLVPLASGSVTVDRSPAILYYEYAAP
jgi:peptidoglycan/xylan/chitin deacetylase (PgdA/CDA1 family)